MNLKLITIQEVNVQEGDLLKHNSTLDNDYYIFVNTGVGHALISLKNGNRYADPCSIEELKTKIEEDGNFMFFGKLEFGEEIPQKSEYEGV